MSGPFLSLPGEHPLVERSRSGPVSVLTLADERRRNVLSSEMRLQLSDALKTVAADSSVGAVVLTGAGGSFSGGGDLSAMPPASRHEGATRMVEVSALINQLASLEKPVVAAVRGAAAGVAAGLVCCCDVVVAGEDSRFLFPFTRLGLVPDGGLLYSLAERVGVARARSILLHADPLDAQRALEIGLADHVTPSSCVLEYAVKCARELATRAPLAVAAVKQGLREGSASLGAALNFEREQQPALFETSDFLEGKAAFYERRDPSFSGR